MLKGRDTPKQKIKNLSADIPSIDAAIADIESQISLKEVVLNTSKVADDKLMMMDYTMNSSTSVMNAVVNVMSFDGSNQGMLGR